MPRASQRANNRADTRQIGRQELNTKYLFSDIEPAERRRLLEKVRFHQLQNRGPRQQSYLSALNPLAILRLVGSEAHIVVNRILALKCQAARPDLIPISQTRPVSSSTSRIAVVSSDAPASTEPAGISRVNPTKRRSILHD